MKSLPRVICFISFILLVNLLFALPVSWALTGNELSIALMFGGVFLVLRELLYFKSRPECFVEILCGGMLGFVIFGHSYAFFLAGFLVSAESVFIFLEGIISPNFWKRIKASCLPYSMAWSWHWLIVFEPFNWPDFLTLTLFNLLSALLAAFLLQRFVQVEVEAT